MNEIQIDKTSFASKVLQLADAIQSAVQHGRYAAGDALPSINELSRSQGIARDTVFKAYKELIRRGVAESSPARGYRVLGGDSKVFMLLDSYSPFKDELYNAFVQALPSNYKVDLAFHHYNFNAFRAIIADSIGKYNQYVVMNFNNEKISAVLKKIDPSKLLILDWGDYRSESYSYVCQDFGEQPYRCFEQALPLLRKYNTFVYVSPDDCAHPEITFRYCEQFCHRYDFSCERLSRLTDTDVISGKAFLVFRQKDLVQLLRICRQKKLQTGRDVGLIAYNDTLLYEVIENGITSISTDFRQMGQTAAHFVASREMVQVVVPTSLIVRGSL